MNSVIIHYQEISLKGRNRPWFIKRLVENIRAGLVDIDVVRVRNLMGRIEIVLGQHADWDEVRTRLSRVFGVANFARARRVGRSMEEITAAILSDLVSCEVRSFRVTARRADKAYAMTSPEIERLVGGHIQSARGWKVDLRNPELVVRIEILPREVFYMLDRYSGSGGLPSGVSGQVLCLMSGGIDSPVAAYRLMKRGCRVRFVHFHSYPILSHASRDKVRELVEHLTKYQLISHLYFVAFGELQQQIVMSVPPPLRIVLYRRLMMRISERLAREVGAKALVTGEAVGQVASQTLENLAVISNVVSELPMLRPLIGSDKQEISAEAIAIGTYPISIIPDQDCCQLFTPRNPATKARLRAVEMAERNLPIDQLIAAALENVEHEDFTFPTQSMQRENRCFSSGRVVSTH
jgi:thiamine biosynthesis protein ThiI